MAQSGSTWLDPIYVLGQIELFDILNEFKQMTC